MTEALSALSTKEEVANYFLKEFKISEEAKNNLIKEDISGDILLDITNADFKSFGIKPGPLLKIKKLLKDDEAKFKPKEIQEKITIKSKAEEVKSFFEKCLNYKQDLNNLDGKGLIELDEEGIKKLGLNFGQKIKILKYIAYFKTLKVEEEVEEPNNEDIMNEDIILNESSTEEEVSKYLRLKLKLSQESIDALGLDASSLFLLKYADVDEMTELKDDEKERLKTLIKELKTQSNITINNTSTKEEVAKFLKSKLNFSEKSINELDLDGEALFILELKDIDEFTEISQEEKDIKQKSEPEIDIKLTKESSAEDVAKFLKFKLNFAEKSIKELELDGEALFMLQSSDIDGFTELTEEEKKKLNEYINEINPKPEPKIDIKITYESGKDDVSKFLKTKINLNEKIIQELNLDGDILFMLDENDINELEGLTEKEKGILNKELNEINVLINDKSNNKDITQFLKINLGFDDKIIKDIDLTGKQFLSLKDEDIDKLNIQEENKLKIKQYLNWRNVTITKASDKTEIAKFLKLQLLFSYKSIKQLNIDGENLFLLKEKDIDDNNKIKNEEKDKLKKLLKAIKPENKKSKYNVFFILMVKDKYKKYLTMKTFEDNGIIRSNIVKYQNNIIYEADYYSKKNDLVKLQIYQVYSDKKINKLSINIKDKFFNTEYNSKINVENDNYFYMDNLNISEKNDFFDASHIIIIKEYLTCIFEETKNMDKKIKVSLLNNILDTIYKERNFELKPNDILKIFKYCCEFKIEPKYINSLEVKKIQEDQKYELDKKYYLSENDYENIDINKNKQKFLHLLIEIYSNYDSEHLFGLMKSKYGKNFSKETLYMLINNKMKFKDLVFKDDKEFKGFQKNLLSVSIRRDEINYIIKLSKGLYNNLIFVKENLEDIGKIAGNYSLSLNEPDVEDDIDQIFIILSDLITQIKEKKYKIFNYDEIFEGLLNVFSNKDLNVLCKLHNIINILKNEKLNIKNIEKFYNKVHQKGMSLIKNKKLKSEEIIQFLVAQDVYYTSPNFTRNDNRDPEVFKYIPITDKDENYLNNINLIKQNKLWSIFSENHKMQTKFYQILIDQMKKIRDFKSIFDIFPPKLIDKEFTMLINGKFKDIILTVLDEQKENFEFLYKIFDNWILINDYNNLNLYDVIEQLEINYELTSKYFFYLLKAKEMQAITEKIKELIINFFLKQNQDGGNNAESLISLLLIAPTNQYLLFFLNQLNNQIMTEKDFYQKEETSSFLLFKLFFEKCNDLMKNEEIAEGEYLFRTVLIKNKILNDLQNYDVQYNLVYNLMEKEEVFYNKILVITGDKNEGKKIFDGFKENMGICEQKLEELRIIEDFYTTFYGTTKENVINLIKRKTIELKNKNVSEIVKLGNNIFDENDNFNFEEAKEESKNIKYKNSCLFMSIYIKNKDNQGIDSEDKIYKDTVNNFKESLTKIIQQKDTKEPFFEINNIEQIMKAIKNPQNDMKKEIDFIGKEFADLGKKDYIEKDLLNDLNNFSKKDMIKKILQGIIELIEAYQDISDIQSTPFMDNIKQITETIKSNGVSGEDIKKAKDFLYQYKYDINKEPTVLMEFYELFFEQKKSVQFLKTIKEKNFDLRYLNEFIDENESSDLQTSDIDNLIYINIFFSKFIQDENIKSDEVFFKAFKEEFEKDKDLPIKFNGYLKSYGEIIQLYQLYNENPEMTIEKISNLLKDSTVELYKDEKINSFTFLIKYKKQGNQVSEANINELDELRNKILLSSSNANVIQNEADQDQKILDKAKLTKDFVSLIDNIKQLNQTLKVLFKSGYFHIKNLSLKIQNGKAFDENNNNKDLQNIVKEYNDINENFKQELKNGYNKYPLLRLFYGQQFILLYEKAKKGDVDISSIINSVTLNKIDNPEVDFVYDEKKKELDNINSYLEKLFAKYNINLKDIYDRNKVLPETSLSPGLYRKTKVGDNNDLIDNILNIYQNLTHNVPIINTLLLCNEETSKEKIEAFINRAILCDKPILFIISNIEYLDLSSTDDLINKLKALYKSKNNKINSYLLFLYEKIGSGLVRDLEKLIPEKYILNEYFMKKPEKIHESLEKIELYSSKFSGYGKTTEIKYKIKDKEGEYKYLPIGGSFTRNYVINNLMNLNLDFQNAKNIYLHLDLSETDNDDLMIEILFKLIVLRYLDSDEKIFYLGYDINIILEIPKGFVEFDKKFKLLNLFKKIHIENLCPLRLEEGKQRIGESHIATVAEVLSYYDDNRISTQNIDLDAPIEKTAKECEQIINKHFNVENQSYYQKMNFIKILSIQFRKFTQNIFFNYELANQDGKGNIISKARKSVISNFISLTKVFTRSPFDGVLLSQNKSIEIFGKYNEDQAIQEGVLQLADEKEKKEIFSFDKIKPSLVFFNRDGGSLSIITNNDKNDEEYNSLKQLWNSQNLNMNVMKELIDYKNMQHNAFLEQIKILFSLDTMSIEDLRKKCEDLGNYIFVADNFIKMVRILLNIEAKIPVILMGETGVGKTKLLEMLATLYGKGNLNWHRLQIHAGTTDKKIVDFIDKVTQEEENKNNNDIVWIFLDEINTCNSLGLITEIMCNHTYLGKKINERFVFLGACNPYRVLTKKMRESGLVYYNLKEKNKLNNLVYTVNPLPHSLLNFIFDFGSLQAEDEKKYIRNTVISILSKIKQKIVQDINENELNKLSEEIIESISISHDFIREKYDKSSVSMREIRRFGIFFEYFIKYFKGKGYDRMKMSLNMTLYLCYYLRINDKEYRKELVDKLNKFYEKSFLIIPEREIRKITREMIIEEGKGIALNRALRENLFTTFTCIENMVPIIIVGKPGTGKSLSFQILFNTLKGENSESPMFRNIGKLYRYYYQGSETSTAEGIEQVFYKALKAKKKDVNGSNICLVFFDEMGLAERSSNNPLKVIHYLLEKDEKDSVPFLGISNWRLDAAKINRALNLSITDYDIKDLEETAVSIAEAIDLDLSNKYKDFFEILAKTYNEYILFNQNGIKENKDFHGNRDFYNLTKTAMRELISRKEELNKSENKVLTESGLLALSRNFGGLENSNEKIREIFKKLYADKYDENVDISHSFSVLDSIKKNVNDPNSRYLMLISEGNDSSDILKYLLESLGKRYIELVGTKYKKDLGKYSEEILNKIKYIMETDNILILRNLDMIYPSLYDLFNQNFTVMGDKRYARIAFEYAKLSSEVNKDFHVVVIVNKNQISEMKLDPPFLNRFEKHIVNFNMLLEEKDIEIAKKIGTYLGLISSFNKNKKLKIDLEKLLINCEQHNIEGLIFKIKNDLLNKTKNNKENNNEDNNADNKEDKNEKHWILKEGPEYEDNMIKEVLKKIVPTFCQDIIASILILEKKLKKYNKIKDIIIDIYKQSNHHNFELFFKNIEMRRNIIYTFSKVTENLLDPGKEIENKFGKFTSQSIIKENIESINSENDLIFILKSFTNSNKKILVLQFTERYLNKINSINYVVNNFHKEIKNLDDKIIIFLIHKQRIMKIKKKKIVPDYITLINEDYYQIFIDNLQGNENLNVMQIMQKKNEDLAKDYMENSDFIEKKIYTVLNYLKYTVLYETKDLNMRNFTTEIAQKIINSKYVKELITHNIKLQGKSVKGIIEDVFISDTMEVNDVDFFEVVNSKLGSFFCNYLLRIIFFSLRDSVLIPLLNNTHFDLITENEYFKNLINEYFDNIDFIGNMPKMNINGNEVNIYNGLELPKSKSFFDLLVKYVNDDVCEAYKKKEMDLRKVIKEEKVEEKQLDYYNKMERFEENIKNEIKKLQSLGELFNQNNEQIKKMLLEDYFIYFICKYLEKKNIKYEINEKLLNFLKIFVKIKLSDLNNHKYEFNYTQEEFIKIIIFTQGYKEDIKIILDVIVELNKYFNNIEETMIDVLENNEIKYEISTRSKRYTKIVNICFYNVIESLIRSILLNSIELHKDKVKFYEFIYSLTSIEASLQKINKKFYLYSKEIYNLRSLIKIEEAFKNNNELFLENYVKIVDNLMEQSILFYENNYNNLFNKILELIKLFDDLFKEKNEEYINLLFFIYRQQYRNIYVEEVRIKLIEKFFQEKLLLRKSKLFLSEILKFLKPEVLNEKNKEETLIKNFMNLEDKKYEKYKNLIKILNNVNSPEFNELLLYYLEGQCQSYFQEIIDKNKKDFNQKCCEELLLKLSLEYLKKAIQYLYETKNKNDNNLLKLFAIAYLKMYLYYYVEINYNKFDNINWDQINMVLDDKDENNELIRKMRNLYIWRLYCKKFENFDQFESFNFENKKVTIYKELLPKLQEEKNKPKYIFKNCFLTLNNFESYQKINSEFEKDKKLKINYEEYNDKFDLLYSVLVNKIISYLYGNEKNDIINKMKEIYAESKDKLIFGEEGKTLYNYLLNNDLFKNQICKKISNKDLTQKEFEILLYSFRFIFNTQINNKNGFYNDILKKNTSEFINNNYIPGSYPGKTLFVQAYYEIEEKLPNNRFGLGYYVCKDCGFFYEVPPCTFPMTGGKCPFMHDIGGEDHVLYKKDIRVFYQDGDYEQFANGWKGCDKWLNSFVPTTLKKFKSDYVDKNLPKINKGIILSDIKEMEKNNPIREIHIISFRILHFILYSYLLGSQILGNLTEKQILPILIDGLMPQTLFSIIKKDWELLESSLNELGIENIQTFFNMIFDKLIILINNLEEVTTDAKMTAFEKEVDKFIIEIISNKETIQQLNKQYQDMINKLLSFDPNSIKEIILGNYDPLIYDQKIYPDIQYYTVSNIQDYETFVNKFKSSKENEIKYFLINTLIKKEEDMSENIINVKNLDNINRLTNALINIYSFKISREDGKKLKLKEQLDNIIEIYNEMNPKKIEKQNDFIEQFIDPFIKSWDSIKSKSVQYKCRLLRDLESGEKPLDMSMELPICYFLVDDGDKEGGMFLASAYQHLIDWQNSFIDIIIGNNRLKGIHNSYVSQLDQEVYIQEATKDEIANIDKNVFKTLNESISNTSMRNIITKDNKVNYKNYNDIIYNYDFIEEELGKVILPGIKKFKKDKIKFVTYLYEGFRGGNSTVLVDYNVKFKQRELNDEEKDSLNKLLEENNNIKFYNDVFASLQILMNEIIKQNYENNHLIYKIIENLPEYIILNPQLIKMFKNKYEYQMDAQIFSIDSLVSIFEHFEALCWKEMKKNLLPDYQLQLSQETKNAIQQYFEENKDKEKLINKNNFTQALRKLIARSLAGTRQEIDIKSEAQLKLYIGREDLWPKTFIDNDNFIGEIYMICKDDVIIGNCFELYNFLDGDSILNNEIYKNKNENNDKNNVAKEQNEEKPEESDNELSEDHEDL